MNNLYWILETNGFKNINVGEIIAYSFDISDHGVITFRDVEANPVFVYFLRPGEMMTVDKEK